MSNPEHYEQQILAVARGHPAWTLLWSDAQAWDMAPSPKKRAELLKKAYDEAWEDGRIAGRVEHLAELKETAVGKLSDLVKDYAGPTVAFSASWADVNELGRHFRWVGITGADRKGALEQAVEAFSAGELAGIALTFQAGSMGFRLEGAKTVVMIGTAPPDVMAQAQQRAPGATLVLL